MKISYRLGTKSWTKEVEENLFDVLQKQLEISIPMITGAKIVKEDGSEKQILVGKKIDLSFNTNYQTYYTDKYDLSLEELIDLYLEGFRSVCLLNYKKYDPIVVGLREGDEVVSDYYALKEKIKEFCK